MKILFSVVLLLAAAGAATWTAPPQAAASQPAGKSLYQRLGGYDAIAAITDDMIPRFVGDPQLKPFFRGLNADHQRLVRQHLVDFLCQATGGPCYYTGRDMKTAHTGLHITDEQWQAAMKEVAASLDNFKVPRPREKRSPGRRRGSEGGHRRPLTCFRARPGALHSRSRLSIMNCPRGSPLI